LVPVCAFPLLPSPYCLSLFKMTTKMATRGPFTSKQVRHCMTETSRRGFRILTRKNMKTKDAQYLALSPFTLDTFSLSITIKNEWSFVVGMYTESNMITHIRYKNSKKNAPKNREVYKMPLHVVENCSCAVFVPIPALPRRSTTRQCVTIHQKLSPFSVTEFRSQSSPFTSTELNCTSSVMGTMFVFCGLLLSNI